MKSTLTLIFIFMIMFNTKILSQETLVKDVRFELKGDNIEIYYTLEGDPEEEYEIQLYLKREEDPSFVYEPQFVTGDIGEGKFVGVNNKIIWNAKKRFPNGLRGEDFYFEVTAEQVGGGLAWYYYIGGAIVAGVSAVLLTKSPPSSTADSESFADPPSRP